MKAERKGKIRIYDNTLVMTAETCLRLYYLRHVRHFTSKEEKIYFVFGSSWGKAMDTLWTLMSQNPRRNLDSAINEAFNSFCAEWRRRGLLDPESMQPEDFADYGARTPYTALEMLHFYAEKRMQIWRNPTFKLIAVEDPFAVPIHSSNKEVLYAGRMDKVFELQRAIRAIEHKTTTVYPKGKSWEAYLNSFSPNNQVDGYNYSGRFKYGKKWKGVWVDIGVVHKDIHDSFHILPIERSPVATDAWLWDIWYWITQIEENRKTLATLPADQPYLTAFPKSTKACYDFPHSCPMLDVCRFNNNPRNIPVPGGMKKEKWEPFDVLKLQKLGIRKENVE